MKFESTISDQVKQARKPLKECPVCGNSELIIKISFKGRSIYRNKRLTQYCSCGWSKIIPTEREAEIELGLIN